MNCSILQRFLLDSAMDERKKGRILQRIRFMVVDWIYDRRLRKKWQREQTTESANWMAAKAISPQRMCCKDQKWRSECVPNENWHGVHSGGGGQGRQARMRGKGCRHSVRLGFLSDERKSFLPALHVPQILLSQRAQRRSTVAALAKWQNWNKIKGVIFCERGKRASQMRIRLCTSIFSNWTTREERCTRFTWHIFIT